MSNNIDKLFKKKLEQESCDPPRYMWERIENQMDARKKKKKLFLWTLSGAAALLLLFSLTWLFELKNEPALKNQIVSDLKPEIQPADTLKEDINSDPSEKYHESKPQVPVLAVNTVMEKNEKANEKQTFFSPLAIRNESKILLVSKPTHVSRINTNTLRRDFIPLTSKEALENNKQYLNLLKENNTNLSVKDEKKNKVNFSLSGHIAPIYSSGKYNPPANSVKKYSTSSGQMNGTVNVSGGLKLSVATGKRFALQTGLFYTQTGQRTKGSNVYLPRTAAFLSSNANSYVTTPLGNIKSKSHAMIYHSEGVIAMRSNSSSGSIEQVFGSLEIPLNIKYQLNDNKVKFTVMGGFSGSFIVNNQAFLEYNNQKELMGETEDIRKFNLSTDFGLGMEYPLSRKVKIILEPGFRYFLQSLSQNSEINYKPYIFSLSTGIGISF